VHATKKKKGGASNSGDFAPTMKDSLSHSPSDHIVGQLDSPNREPLIPSSDIVDSAANVTGTIPVNEPLKVINLDGSSEGVADSPTHRIEQPQITTAQTSTAMATHTQPPSQAKVQGDRDPQSCWTTSASPIQGFNRIDTSTSRPKT